MTNEKVKNKLSVGMGTKRSKNVSKILGRSQTRDLVVYKKAIRNGCRTIFQCLLDWLTFDTALKAYFMPSQ